MDGAKFDLVAKAVAGGSRRSLLKAGLGAALGGLFGARLAGPAAAIACPNVLCTGPRAQPCPSPCVCVSWANGNSRCLTPTATTCSTAGQKLCNGRCVPVTSCCTAADCADDGNPCTDPACDAGTCVYQPKADGTPCDDGNAATSGETCQVGVCTCLAQADSEACGARVCGPATNNCGQTVSCGTCGANQTCDANGSCLGTLGAACGGDGECVSGVCADGVCCDAACAGQCEACNAAGSIGTCSPLTGPACDDGNQPANTDGACVGGVCQYTCQAGFADCDGNPTTGCEAELASDPANCGGCGAACSSSHMATVACVGGSCESGTCAAGFADCNGDKRTDGCETDLGGVANCGACGQACGPGEICTASACLCTAGDCLCGGCKLVAHLDAAGVGTSDPGDPDASCDVTLTLDSGRIGYEMSCSDISGSVSAVHIHPLRNGKCIDFAGTEATLPVDAGGNGSGCATIHTAAAFGRLALNPTGYCVLVHSADYGLGAVGGRLAYSQQDTCAAEGGTCTPYTCDDLAAECGNIQDGCGGTLACGGCTGGEVCGEEFGASNRCVPPSDADV